MVGLIIHRTSVAVFIANSSRRARWPIGKTPPDPAAEVGDPNLAGSPAHASLKGPVCSGDAAIRVSVIVPAYNNADELSQCLSALRTATGAESELIVVDDASNDDVSSTAARFGARFLRLARNAAPPPRNHGARHARGQILFFVDADVVVPNDAVTRIRTILDCHEEMGAVFGSYDSRPSALGLVSQYRNLLHHFVHQTGKVEAATFWGVCVWPCKVAGFHCMGE